MVPKLIPTEPLATSQARRIGDIPGRRSNMGKGMEIGVWQEQRESGRD